MANLHTHSVRKHATDGRVNGVKQIVYVASCSCGWHTTKATKSSRDREAEQHGK